MPQLGSCASSGRAWRLWAALAGSALPGRGRPTGRPAAASGARARVDSEAADVIPPPVDPSQLLYNLSTLLRHDAFPEDKDSSDEMVFGDDDNLDDYM